MRTLDHRKFLTVSAGVGLADATWAWTQDARGGTHPEVFNRGQFTGEADSRTRRTFYVRSPNDPRSRLMTSLGFVVPEQIAQLAGDRDAFTSSKEQFSTSSTSTSSSGTSSASRTPSRHWCRNWRMPPPNRPDAAVTRTGLRAG
ncbi:MULTISPECIES: hypothetical protein [Rhodococcus]|uniref:hypothetical protein n=1 Tax=Rhodococcus TaxID=1827 RepID=UPI000306FA74|nr:MULTISPECIES: hypothetical protein [Rhodococcus]